MRILSIAGAAFLAIIGASTVIGTAEARPPWAGGGGGGGGWSQRGGGGPPSWAPAWGYRARQSGIHPGRAAHMRRDARRSDRIEWRAEQRRARWR